MPKQNADGAGHEEEHGTGEEEAIRDPLVVEQTGRLCIERAEEAFDAAGRSVWVKDARVAGLPGYEASEKGERDRQPGPEDRRGYIGLGVGLRCEFCGCGGKEGAEEIAKGLAEFAEGDQPNEKSGGGEGGQEVAEDESDSGQLRPVHSGRDSPDGSGDEPGETDRRDHDEEVEEEAFGAPCDGFQHGSGVAQAHHPWCRIIDGLYVGRLILRIWRGPRDLERRRVR